VTRADGQVVTFAVTLVASYPKTGFPAALVYGPHGDRELHLVTCGGTFDPRTRSYLSNVVVYTTMVSPAAQR
jgi:hypothetical protein